LDLARVRVRDDGLTGTPIVGLAGPVTDPRESEVLLRRTGARPLMVTSDHLVGDCAQMQDVAGFTRCDDRGFVLSGELAERLRRAGYPTTGVRLLEPQVPVETTIFVSGDWQVTDEALRTLVANRSVPGFPVLNSVNRVHESPVTAWLVGGLTVAALAAAAALGLHVVSHSARVALSRVRLAYLGADLATVRRLAGCESALTIVVAGALSTAIGVFGSWCFVQVNPEARLPAHVIAVVIGVIGAASAFAGAAAWLVVPSATDDTVNRSVD
jgi:hypothetical protein